MNSVCKHVLEWKQWPSIFGVMSFKLTSLKVTSLACHSCIYYDMTSEAKERSRRRPYLSFWDPSLSPWPKPFTTCFTNLRISIRYQWQDLDDNNVQYFPPSALFRIVEYICTYIYISFLWSFHIGPHSNVHNNKRSIYFDSIFELLKKMGRKSPTNC